MAVMQATLFECLSFDPFPLFENDLMATEVDIGWCDAVQSLMIRLVIVVVDDGFDLCNEIDWQEVVFQQHVVLQGLMPALGLAVGLGMIRRTARVLHSFVPQPLS